MASGHFLAAVLLPLLLGCVGLHDSQEACLADGCADAFLEEEGHLRLLQVKARALGSRPSKASSTDSSLRPSKLESGEPADAVSGCDDDAAPCPTGLTCARKLDGSYAQCVSCSTARFQRECGFWDADLRSAAVLACRRQCEKAPAILPCSIGSSFPDYGHQNCVRGRKGSMTMLCPQRSPDTCGTRIGSDRPTGAGTYSVSLKAARGPGVATAFYLYTWGEDNKRTRAWNEIDFEVLGGKADWDSSLVWTNFFTKPFDANQPRHLREAEHNQYIQVPFDVTGDYHNYTLALSESSIEWLIDAVSYRKVELQSFPDLAKTIRDGKFRAYLAVWGQNSTSGKWKEMGFLENNELDFPLSASFSDLTLPDSLET